MSGPGPGGISKALTAAQILARLETVSKDTAADVRNQVPAPPRSPGMAVVAAQDLGAVQAAIGYRRPFSPFSY